MQHQTAIYSPTTSQRLAAKARKARLIRMGSLPAIPDEQIRNACELACLLTTQDPSRPQTPMGEVEKIQRAVISHFPQVTLNDLKAARRDAVVVRPRQIAMYLAKELTQRSLPEIGRRFGGRDHTTILHAVRKIKTGIPKDPALASDIETIKIYISEMC